MNKPYSDLVVIEKGRSVLPPEVHPLPDLLDLSAEEVLEAFRASQRSDFIRVVAEAEAEGADLHRLFGALRDRVPAGHPFRDVALFRKGALGEMFLDLHDHVMAHPVWRHPFFLRVFEGRVAPSQVRAFACHYFNQIKNTRQCVALAIGRFHGLTAMPFGELNERLSEITQVALAQLVADEYGVGGHSLDDYPPLSRLFSAHTHIAMYRQLFEGLGIPPAAQDVPMLPAVADNVLTQRLVAGHPAFSPLESLASVGLGMEWGVPEFFSLLLGGLIRVGRREKLPLSRHHVEVFSAHVRYDVLHAVSVMLVTSLHMRGAADMAAAKGACNTLMASRYGMMTGLYGEVFGDPCASLGDLALEGRYRLADRRIEAVLIEARQGTAPDRVVGGDAYRKDTGMPFVFA
ncbi:MAG: iron-containing redox enzyme family protein [Magnetospirillum sp. WYHS-4]